jgi:uncharacterized protein (DUF362 family)/NAD-dependent dihydropyrimidine dehydrogenase PreA subunit
MNKSKVALARCTSYDESEVMAAVKRGTDLLGGMPAFVKPGERIVLKLNVLIGSNPDSCVCTHPSVFKAVGTLLKEAGARVYYGDSPAFGPSSINLRIAGLKKVGDECGFTAAEFDTGRTIDNKNGLLIKQFTIASGVLDSDGLISIPKFKTHQLTRFTGSVKNQFGCIPGFLKGGFHSRLPDVYDFAAMLVDINTCVKPRLFIMDGVEAMEGNGPRNGKPRKMNVILLSADPIALDATACRMIGLDPEFVPTSKPGEKSGLGTYHGDNIELLGDPFESFITPDFKAERSAPISSVGSTRLRTFIKNRINDRLTIDYEKCDKCGTCIKMCPLELKAIDWVDGTGEKRPAHNHNRCVRCYCCQELCPQGAITVRKSFLSKAFTRN